MATALTASPDAASATPSSSDGSAPDDMSQGFTIEIDCLPDGTFNVSVEPLAEEQAEEQGGDQGAGEASEGGQQASSIQEALKIARQLFEAGGQSDGGDADFASGFGGKGNGSNLDMGS